MPIDLCYTAKVSIWAVKYGAGSLSTSFFNRFCVTWPYCRHYFLVMAVSSRLKLPVLLLRYRVTTCFLINSRFDRKKIQLCIFYFLLFIYQNGFPHIFPLQVILSLSSKSLVFSAWSFSIKTQPVSMYHRCLALGFLRIFFSLFSISFLWPSYSFYFIQF